MDLEEHQRQMNSPMTYLNILEGRELVKQMSPIEIRCFDYIYLYFTTFDDFLSHEAESKKYVDVLETIHSLYEELTALRDEELNARFSHQTHVIEHFEEWQKLESFTRTLFVDSSGLLLAREDLIEDLILQSLPFIEPGENE